MALSENGRRDTGDAFEVSRWKTESMHTATMKGR